MSPTYFKHLDGLRALAIIGVILFHGEFIAGGIALFSNGYLGVDVFFVISGFLVTAALSRCDAGYLKFLWQFCQKRFLRVAPALYASLILQLPVFFYFAAPSQLMKVSETIESAVLFQSNLVLGKQDNYWNGLVSFNPFLHTWSLSIEMQSYLIFALVGLFSLKFKRLSEVSILLATISLLFVVIKFDPQEQDFFFQIEARFWEFGLGSLAFIISKHTSERTYPAENLICDASVLSLLLVLFAGIVNFNVAYINQLTAAIIAMLICACRPGRLTKTCLENRTMVFIGLVSFSLYVWHWPALNFVRYFSNQIFLDAALESQLKILVIIVSSGIAAASYKLVESPLRYKPLRQNNMRLLVAGVLGLFAFAFAFQITESNGYVGVFSAIEKDLMDAASEHHPDNTKYVNEVYKSQVENREFSNNGQPKVLLIGDSYSQDFFNILNEGGYVVDIDLSAVRVTQECFVMRNLNLQQLIGAASYKDNKCNLSPRVGDVAVDQRIERADIVILASAWEDHSIRHLPEMVSYLKSNLGVNDLFVVGQKRLRSISAFDFWLSNPESLFEKTINTPPSIKEKNEILSSMTGFHFVDIQDLNCGNEDKCRFLLRPTNIIAYDGRHLSKSGARFFAKLLRADHNFNLAWKSATKRQ